VSSVSQSVKLSCTYVAWLPFRVRRVEGREVGRRSYAQNIYESSDDQFLYLRKRHNKGLVFGSSRPGGVV